MSPEWRDRIAPFWVYGTAWKEADTQCCVRDALRAGFRAIDTANQRKHYVGQSVSSRSAAGRSNSSTRFKISSVG